MFHNPVECKRLTFKLLLTLIGLYSFFMLTFVSFQVLLVSTPWKGDMETSYFNFKLKLSVPFINFEIQIYQVDNNNDDIDLIVDGTNEVALFVMDDGETVETASNFEVSTLLLCTFYFRSIYFSSFPQLVFTF